MRLAMFLAAVSCLLLPSPSLADSEEPPDRVGVYVGAGMAFGVATELGDLADAMFGDDARVDSAVGVSGRVGWRLHRRLAVEGQVEWLAGFGVKLPGDVQVVEGSTLLATGNLKGYLANNDRVEPFVLVGLGYYYSEAEETGSPKDTSGDFAARLGGGVDVIAGDHFTVTIDASYILPTGKVDDGDYISIGVGLLYRF